ncbi:hypothetical protein [Leptospira saintgironsiae]|uniref:Uncharacterized protein n=1 Tax=Leptospira saintgironsiae TaxID=2023183 RepID=A0A2M9Y7E5_9LEPT|nr:hypothetical protein [Leptospira saintgironsiae]PJZ47484.1 hypothetical protein CH362_18940 [Leptospira saintgironsiae]
MKKYIVYGLFGTTLLFPFVVIGIIVSQWEKSNLIDYSKFVETAEYKFIVEKLNDRTFSKFFSEEINTTAGLQEFLSKAEKYLTGTVKYELLEYNHNQKMNDGIVDKYTVLLLKGIRNDSMNYFIKITLRQLEEDKISIVGIYFNDLNTDLEENLSLSSQAFTTMHIIALGIALAVSLIIVGSSYSIAFRNPPKRQMLWMFLNMLGISKLLFNWSTASFSYQLIYVSFIGVSFSKTGNLGSWLLGSSVPIFSIIHLIRAYYLPKNVQEHSD